MGERVSKEAIDRNRTQARLRSAVKRAANRDQYNAEMQKYRANNHEHRNEVDRMRYGADIAALAARPFIAWDGEGYSTEDGSHHYMLFGCSHFPDDPMVGRDLSTRACLEYILYVESQYPNAFHVGFAFDYDVNMILKDLPSHTLKHLAVYSVCHWQGYRLMYIPGKMFRVTKGPKGSRVSATIEDVFGFFHSKYTTSLIKFGVATKKELAHIEEGKSKRGSFTYADIDYVKEYWQDEISYFVPLMDRIRDACYDAGLYVMRWHGPGALASYMLRKRGVKNWMSNPEKTPMEVQIATRYAYAGGRFQPWHCGLYHHHIYTADINSAYIFACSLLPRMDNGRWRRQRKVDRSRIARFGLYQIAFDAGYDKAKDNHKRGAFEEIHPLFHRDKNGGLYWPARTEGWYWSPEASIVADNPNARFLEAWIYDDDGTYPFQWVDEEFNKRLELQHEGNPAEKTFKWALAAMYGAFARLVGWDRKNCKAPRSHELAWAGFITSWCRAEMYRVGYECWRRGGLISIDTDGVTSTVPFESEWLDRGVGEKLGQWKLEEFAGIMYWQNGFYWLMDDNGEWSTVKTRGVKRGSLDVDVVLEAYNNASYVRGDVRPAKIEQKRTKFIGFKEALNRHDGLKSWRKWIDYPLESVMGRSGTSRHIWMYCIKCRNPEADRMHVLTHFPPTSPVSEPHKLPWLEEVDELPPFMIIPEMDEADKL
jgi:hypothetical protein